MTSTGGSTTPAGWFTDPGGSGQLRWWDGSAWTAHLTPAPTPTPTPTPVVPVPVAQAPVAQTPVVPTPTVQAPVDPAPVELPPVAEQQYVPLQNAWGSGAPASAYTAGADDFARPAQWNTAGAWLLAFSGLIELVALFVALKVTGASVATPYGSGVLLGAVAVAFLISLLFAEADRRKLRSLGYIKVPSLWWMLLAPPLVYLIIRTVIVWGEVRKGIAPLITFIVVNIASSVVASLTIALLLPGALGGGASTLFAASLQAGLDENGGHFTVTCPSLLPTTIGTTFDCTAVDGSGVAHVLAIKIVAGAGGRSTTKLVSVTPAITG